MISSVSMNSSMSMMNMGGMQKPPADKDVFQASDTDSDGLVSSTELETLAAGIEETTGVSIDIEEAMATYDTDEDGSLSGEEMFGLMSSQGFNPAGLTGSEEDGMMPPPPPPADQVSSAYSENSGEDTISQLISYLNENSSSDESYSSVALSA